jgi:uncharacterized membrane protein YeaQ/YmgE (transglycosylase-associated protein family)
MWFARARRRMVGQASACASRLGTGFAGERSCAGRATREEAAMYMSTESIVIIIVVGLIAGWLAGKIVRGSGFGLIGDIAIGIVGALIATWLFPRLGIRLGTGLLRQIIEATVGAVLLLLIIRLLAGRRRW